MRSCPCQPQALPLGWAIREGLANGQGASFAWGPVPSPKQEEPKGLKYTGPCWEAYGWIWKQST